jgi:hypothetical protein
LTEDQGPDSADRRHDFVLNGSSAALRRTASALDKRQQQLGFRVDF